MTDIQDKMKETAINFIKEGKGFIVLTSQKMDGAYLGINEKDFKKVLNYVRNLP